MHVDSLKSQTEATVSEHAETLLDLSETLHANPETAWEEFASSEAVADLLEDRGFTVTRNYMGFETAFLAEVGSGSRTVGFMAEYDALPGLGHACGHNLIAASSVGAGIALAPLADELDMTIRVYGTPAEEGGAGKVELIDAGAFQDLDFAMMVHPAPVDIAEAEPFAVSHKYIEYTGVSAHAAAYPDEGINANDAFVIAQVAIGLLRQQLPPDTRIHGVQTVGGSVPNAIPDKTAGRWYIRATTLEELAEVERKVEACFEAGAVATGAELKITEESKSYAELRTHEPALEAYKRNALARGREFADAKTAGRMNRASTDMGNVSQLVPAIHPYIGVDSLPYTNHQKGFADACIGPVAEQTLLDAAVLMAWTTIDLYAADTNDSVTPGST